MEQALIWAEGPEPAGKAKPDVCALSDGEAGAYCTVELVFYEKQSSTVNNH